MQLLLIKYGLIAVFLAAAVEADVVPVLTGALAHFGYMNPRLAVLCAAFGAFAGDCLWFLAGWKHSIRIQGRSIYARIAPMVERLTARIGLWQIPASHLIYGTRVATMIQFGVRRVTPARFVLVDGSACLVITFILFALGFGLSASATQIIGHVKRLELFMLVLVIASGLVFHLVSRIARRTFANEANLSRIERHER